ncbi:hypothetical protein ACIQNU_38700 [Streptomyces sp. NPDC091292]|uniref:hypothetical protein n=1 Tax=Streptomyces sp. NPDC091292 TaxID=3365991 RepID=UPI0037F3EEF1
MESDINPNRGSGRLSPPEISGWRAVGPVAEAGIGVPEAGAALRTLDTALRRIVESQRSHWADICGSGGHEHE